VSRAAEVFSTAEGSLATPVDSLPSDAETLLPSRPLSARSRKGLEVPPVGRLEGNCVTTTGCEGAVSRSLALDASSGRAPGEAGAVRLPIGFGGGRSVRFPPAGGVPEFEWLVDATPGGLPDAAPGRAVELAGGVTGWEAAGWLADRTLEPAGVVVETAGAVDAPACVPWDSVVGATAGTTAAALPWLESWGFVGLAVLPETVRAGSDARAGTLPGRLFWMLPVGCWSATSVSGVESSRTKRATTTTSKIKSATSATFVAFPMVLSSLLFLRGTGRSSPPYPVQRFLSPSVSFPASARAREASRLSGASLLSPEATSPLETPNHSTKLHRPLGKFRRSGAY
jgi:hypothetical protein